MVGEREVDAGNDIYGNPIKRIQYEVKQIKVGEQTAGSVEWGMWGSCLTVTDLLLAATLLPDV